MFFIQYSFIDKQFVKQIKQFIVPCIAIILKDSVYLTRDFLK